MRPEHTASVVHGDARRLPFADASVDAIVTSPPYFVTYDYFDVQRLSYLAFGWPYRRSAQIGARYGHQPVAEAVGLPPAFQSWYVGEFRGEATVLGRALRAYVQDLRSHLAEAARVVASGGLVAYSLANIVRAGRTFDLVTGFTYLLEEAGFVDVHAAPRMQSGRRILAGMWSVAGSPATSTALVSASTSSSGAAPDAMRQTLSSGLTEARRGPWVP